MEEGGRPFNPANSIQIDPNDTLRIPSEFHQQTSKIPQQPPRNNRNSYNVPYSPFMNPTQPHRGYTSAFPQSSFVPPPDSPLIHVPGRLSLKSPSISNTPNINNNGYSSIYPNSPYPQQMIQMSNSRSKVPRRVIKRQ